MATAMGQLVSIIIPTLNEETSLRKTLNATGSDQDTECIVVDGGSTDNTCSIARQCVQQVFVTSASRARQMNMGAQHARGDILLFLHADTLLPAGALSMVRDILQKKPNIVGGGFAVKFDNDALLYNLTGRLSTLRARMLGWIYGDQALFVRRNVFNRLGGFRDIPIMEDFEFSTRCRREGKLVVLGPPVLSSARRWVTHGFWRTAAVHWLVGLGYLLGASPDRLLAFSKSSFAVKQDGQAVWQR